MIRRQARERGLELERFLNRLVDEVLYDFLTPGPERSAAESPAEPSDPSEANAAKLPRVAVEHVDADVVEDFGDIRFLPRFEVVIPEHRDDGDLRRRSEEH